MRAQATRLLLPLTIALVACSSGAQESKAPGADASRRPLAEGQEPRDASADGVGFDHGHVLWTEVLAAHVHGDRIDYAALAKDPAKLDAYLDRLHAVTPEELASWTKDQRFAFWINVYNAHTVKKVVDAYPIDSIKDLDRMFGAKSVFSSEFIDMVPHHPGGKRDKLSLNDVEHDILRKRFQDARVHAAINCAAHSCPPLLGEAFVADELDDQLDARMRAFVFDPKRNRFDHAKNRLRLSKIFKWFDEDFERDAGSVREFIARLASEEDAELIRKAKIEFLDYSWKLNDVERPN